MGVRACSLSCVESAASTAPSTWKAALALGAGCPGTRRDASSPTPRAAEESDHAADDADQAHVAGHDRLVGGIFGDQLDVAVATLEAFDGGVSVDQGDDDRAVGRLLLRPHEDHVAVEDAGVDQALASDPEQEIALLGHLGRKQEVVFDVLLGEDRGAGGDVADDRNGDGVSPLLVDLDVLYELDRAGFAGVTLDQAPALELVEVV